MSLRQNSITFTGSNEELSDECAMYAQMQKTVTQPVELFGTGSEAIGSRLAG